MLGYVGLSELSLHPGNEIHLIMVNGSFNVPLNLVC